MLNKIKQQIKKYHLIEELATDLALHITTEVLSDKLYHVYTVPEFVVAVNLYKNHELKSDIILTKNDYMRIVKLVCSNSTKYHDLLIIFTEKTQKIIATRREFRK